MILKYEGSGYGCWSGEGNLRFGCRSEVGMLGWRFERCSLGYWLVELKTF